MGDAGGRGGVHLVAFGMGADVGNLIEMCSWQGAGWHKAKKGGGDDRNAMEVAMCDDWVVEACASALHLVRAFMWPFLHRGVTLPCSVRLANLYHS